MHTDALYRYSNSACLSVRLSVFIAFAAGDHPSEFREDVFDAGKTRMIGLPYCKKNYDDMLSRFYLIPECYGLTDGQTELLYQYRASVC